MQLRLYVIRTVAAAMERVGRASSHAGGGGGDAEYAGVMLFVLKLLVANTDDLARETPPSAKEAQPTAALAAMDRKLDRILAREDEILRTVRGCQSPSEDWSADRSTFAGRQRMETCSRAAGRPAPSGRPVGSRRQSAPGAANWPDWNLPPPCAIDDTGSARGDACGVPRGKSPGPMAAEVEATLCTGGARGTAAASAESAVTSDSPATSGPTPEAAALVGGSRGSEPDQGGGRRGRRVSRVADGQVAGGFSQGLALAAERSERALARFHSGVWDEPADTALEGAPTIDAATAANSFEKLARSSLASAAPDNSSAVLRPTPTRRPLGAHRPSRRAAARSFPDQSVETNPELEVDGVESGVTGCRGGVGGLISDRTEPGREGRLPAVSNPEGEGERRLSAAGDSGGDSGGGKDPRDEGSSAAAGGIMQPGSFRAKHDRRRGRNVSAVGEDDQGGWQGEHTRECALTRGGRDGVRNRTPGYATSTQPGSSILPYGSSELDKLTLSKPSSNDDWIDDSDKIVGGSRALQSSVGAGPRRRRGLAGHTIVGYEGYKRRTDAGMKIQKLQGSGSMHVAAANSSAKNVD